MPKLFELLEYYYDERGAAKIKISYTFPLRNVPFFLLAALLDLMLSLLIPPCVGNPPSCSLTHSLLPSDGWDSVF